ncbi:PaaI family thioesterase [Streptomyces sp. BBFR2]|uniref:PaaI family thioesterase n=1 Tax=Streptomyces sp. BBFR2 TaxID=3372854 RepID=UPI0037DA28DE
MNHRTYVWRTPPDLDRWRHESDGLGFVRRLMSDPAPCLPAVAMLGDVTLDEVEPGRVVLSCRPGRHLASFPGVMHGGVIATLCDTAAALATQARLPAGYGGATADLAVRMLRPVRTGDEPVLCTGTVVEGDLRRALTEARVTGADGTLYAHATATMLLRPCPPPDDPSHA